MSDEYFTVLVKKAMSELSPEHMEALENVAILVADEPTPEQRRQLELRNDTLLLGLYEGIPITQRGGYESGIMADTITIFKKPIMAITHTEQELYEQIKRTVWHEIAHYYGISHEQMHALQHKSSHE